MSTIDAMNRMLEFYARFERCGGSMDLLHSASDDELARVVGLLEGGNTDDQAYEERNLPLVGYLSRLSVRVKRALQRSGLTTTLQLCLEGADVRMIGEKSMDEIDAVILEPLGLPKMRRRDEAVFSYARILYEEHIMDAPIGLLFCDADSTWLEPRIEWLVGSICDEPTRLAYEKRFMQIRRLSDKHRLVLTLESMDGLQMYRYYLASPWLYDCAEDVARVDSAYRCLTDGLV